MQHRAYDWQFIDPDFRPYEFAPLEALPFDLADVQEQLKRLPVTKALAPPTYQPGVETSSP